jgi:hypothetical protein
VDALAEILLHVPPLEWKQGPHSVRIGVPASRQFRLSFFKTSFATPMRSTLVSGDLVSESGYADSEYWSRRPSNALKRGAGDGKTPGLQRQCSTTRNKS